MARKELGRELFTSCHSLERFIFYEVLIILTLGFFIIEVSHVAVVHIMLSNNHIKFLTKTTISLARLMDMVHTITLMD